MHDDGRVQFFWGRGKPSAKAAKGKARSLLGKIGSLFGYGKKSGTPSTKKSRSWKETAKSIIGKAPSALGSLFQAREEAEEKLAGAIWGEDGKEFVRATQGRGVGYSEEDDDFEEFVEYEGDDPDDYAGEDEDEWEEGDDDDDDEYYDQHLDIPIEAILSDDDYIPIWDKAFFSHMGDHRPVGLYFDKDERKFEFFWGALAAAAIPLVTGGLNMGMKAYQQRKAKKAARRARRRAQMAELAELERERQAQLSYQRAMAQQAARTRALEYQAEEDWDDDEDYDDYEEPWDDEDDYGDFEFDNARCECR